MKKIIKLVLLTVLCIEMGWFGYYSLFGRKGYIALYKTSKKTKAITQEIAQLEQELKELKNDIKFSKISLFYHEQYARTRLHMAREDEDIYLT